MTTVTFRTAEASDALDLSILARRTLLPHTLPGWTTQAVERLLAENSEQALREYLTDAAFAHLCTCTGSVIGFIASKIPRLISLLMVDPAYQRRGIGSQLVDRALENISDVATEISVVEVNATQYSLPFYRARGFYPISEFIEFQGCRFMRLGYWRKNPLLVPQH